MDFGITPAELRTGLIFFILLFSSMILCAFAQAWLADRLGDPTPRDQGRVTLDPTPHIDLLGTIILPLVCIFFLQPKISAAGLYFFVAWTKPIVINGANFSNPRRHYLYTQFAPFAMSVLLSVVAAIVGGLTYRFDSRTTEIFVQLIGINAMLIVISLLPVPPLPGAMLLRHWGMISEERFWQIARWSGLGFMLAMNISIVRGILGILIQIAAYPFMALFEVIAKVMMHQ